MNIDLIRKKFIKYAKTFNLKEKAIMGKFHHSFRVMEYANMIAREEGLKEEDVVLANVIGLLHDIARFYQWTNYKTYVDSKSIDHGDYGEIILKEEKFLDEFDIKDEEKEIIYKAIINHNKYDIDNSLNERELLHAKIIRDADKLDIMKEQCNKLTKNFDEINPKIKEDLLNQKLVNNDNTHGEVDYLLRCISFTFDINFKCSLIFLKQENILENKFNLLEIYANNIDEIEEIKKVVFNYLEGEISC